MSPRHGQRVSQYGCHITRAAGGTERCHLDMAAGVTVRLSPRPGQHASHYGCHLDARYCQFDPAVGGTHDLLQLFPEDAATHGVEEEVDGEARYVERANVALTRYHGNER